MGPVVVVLRPVLLDVLLGVSEIDKVMLSCCGALDGRVVGRFTGSTEVHAHLVPVAPVIERDRRELGAVVALNDRGDPALVAESAQRRHHIVGAQPNRGHQPDAFPRVQIDDAEHAERGAIGELIVDEVHRPAFVGGARQQARSARYGAAASLRSFALLREPFVLIQPLHAPVIDRPAFATKEHMQTPIAVGHLHLR